MNDLTPINFDYASIEDPLLAQELRNRADEVRALDRGIVHNVITIGRHLLAAKARLEHGQFTGWLQAEFGLSHSTANNYMAVAERFGQNPNAVGNLPLRTVYALAPSSVPDAAVEEAATIAAAGLPVTPGQARDIRDDVAAAAEADPDPAPDDPTLADRILAVFATGHYTKSSSLIARLTGIDEFDLAHELAALVEDGKLRSIGDSGKLFALVEPQQAPGPEPVTPSSRHSGPAYQRILAAFAAGAESKTVGMIAHLTGLNDMTQPLNRRAIKDLVDDGYLLPELNTPEGTMYRITIKTPRKMDASIIDDERELYELARRIIDWLNLQSEPRSVLNMVDCTPPGAKLATIVNAVEHLLALGRIERVGSSLYRIIPIEESLARHHEEMNSLGDPFKRAMAASDEVMARAKAAAATSEPAPANAPEEPAESVPPTRTQVLDEVRALSGVDATDDQIIDAFHQAFDKEQAASVRTSEPTVNTASESAEPAAAESPDESKEFDEEIKHHSRTMTNAQYEMLKAIYQGDTPKRDAPSRTALINRGLIRNFSMGEQWEFDKVEVTDKGRAVVEYTMKPTMAPFPPAESPDDQPGEATPDAPALTNVGLSVLVMKAADALRQHGQGMYYNELKHFVPGVNGEVNQALAHGVKVGVLLKNDANYYTLPEFAARAQVDPDPITSARDQITWLLASVKTAEDACRNLMKFTAQGSWNDIDSVTLKDARAAVRRAQGAVEKAAMHLSNLYAPLTSANEVALKREQAPAPAEREIAEVH